jgi:hypothetical protein
LSSQTNIKNNFEICNSDFQLYFKRIYSKDIIDHIKFNRDSSYSYYSDYLTGRNEKVNYRDIDSLKIIPYQYVLIYNVLDVNDDVLTSLKIDCRCYDDLLRMDEIEDYYEILKPAMEVIKGKALTLREVFNIARKRGYSITEWNLDYEKTLASNEYKKFLPKLVWTIKEKIAAEKGGYYKVLEINARNGSIMNEYKEYGL